MFHVVAVGTQFRFNNTVLQMLPEGSTASLNKTLVPDSSLIGLYLGSTDLTFDDDFNEEAPVKVYFHHDSLDSYYEVGFGHVQETLALKKYFDVRITMLT